MRFTGRFAVVLISAVLAASQCWHVPPALGEPPSGPAATVAISPPQTPPQASNELSAQNASGPFGAATALLALVMVVAAMARLKAGEDRGATGPGNEGRTTL